jgi:hypothetical protein
VDFHGRVAGCGLRVAGCGLEVVVFIIDVVLPIISIISFAKFIGIGLSTFGFEATSQGSNQAVQKITSPIDERGYLGDLILRDQSESSGEMQPVFGFGGGCSIDAQVVEIFT